MLESVWEAELNAARNTIDKLHIECVYGICVIKTMYSPINGVKQFKYLMQGNKIQGKEWKD
jgi:hypothetical protein